MQSLQIITGAYTVILSTQALWVPGSQTELAVVTDTFVKIYDLASDAISPAYYYIVCSGKIRDATILVVDGVSDMFRCVYVCPGVCT